MAVVASHPVVHLAWSHFGTTVGVNFATLGSRLEHFGFAFAPLESFLEHFGYIFCVKKRIGAPKVPQERPKAPTPVSPSHFGSHFGGYFRWFLWFFPFRTRCKNICVFRCVCVCVCVCVFCVIFLILGAGRTSKIYQKHCSVVQKQGVRKILENRAQVSFREDFVVISESFLCKNVIFLWKKAL